jgi:predicted transcriptional regulator
MGKMHDVSVSVSDAMLAEIDRLVAPLGKDRGWLLYEALRRLVEEHRAMDAFVQAGLDSAEQEGTLSQHEVAAWFAERRHQRAAAE